ncbi:MAG TPA: acyloxyacyl hydrolase [Acidobacteriaceae bacterium]|nr:acyloxyacyl hydrolase [Acidobacteriaceae bacterium]
MLLLLMTGAGAAWSQDSKGYLVPANQWSGFAEYSNDSSHIVLGVSENRKLAAVGGAYARRLLRTPVFTWQYLVEVRPFLLESDPVGYLQITPGPGSGNSPSQSVLSLQRSSDCFPVNETVTYTDPVTGQMVSFSVMQSCGRRWTYAAALSPLGQKINFWPKRHLQPFAVGNAGFLVAAHPIPLETARRFNFTFEFGAGLEWIYRPQRSVALEYRVHHISNDFTAESNPGVDSGTFKVTYSFSR